MRPGYGSSIWDGIATVREAEDERLLQDLAGGKGRGLDAETLRKVVSDARSMLGLDATFDDVEVVGHAEGYEVVVWYRFPATAGTDPGPGSEAVSFHIEAPRSLPSPATASPRTQRRRATGADVATRTHQCGMTSALRATVSAVARIASVSQTRVRATSRPSSRSQEQLVRPRSGHRP
jgi:hypothetical protein